MINEKNARSYCCEDLSLIEGYAEAVIDSKLWDCHHRAETDEILTHKELKAQGRYWKRPASELVFLTKSAHMKLHYDAGTCENARDTWATIGRKNSKKVLQFTKDGTFVQEWPSTIEVERQLGFNQGNISSCCSGRYKSAHGFVWRYA